MQKGVKKYLVSMDEHLASLGLYRKMMARDASCLFRALSEQLYYSQSYHQKIRSECANFMRENHCRFEPFVEGSFEKYLERLEDPKETAGQVEIKALSLLYRRCFQIYRFPGKPATVISEDDFNDKVMLCCSNNGHYDIVYPRNYPASAALCQSVLYELLYTRVFSVEEAELAQALEGFRVGGRRYRNSLSACSDGDLGYDPPEERGHRDDWEVGGAEEKPRPPADDSKGAVEAGSRLSLPYKVLKSLDGELYRNLEFDVWHDTRKELQKTDYMVFAGRQYFLGDKCQVRLEPKGKYYNAFIQEVGTHTSSVTVFIEELGERHLVPLANLKPVNPVPAWNVAPSRKGELEECRSRRHRYFRKMRGGVSKGAEFMMVQSSYRPAPSQPGLPPRFQPGPPPAPGAVTYDPYAPPTRPPRYGSSTRFLNRHLIGPQLAYYHPGRRYYHGYDNYAFRSRRARRHLASMSKEGPMGFPAEGEEPPEGPIAYYQLEEGDEVAPPLQGQPVPPPPLMGAPHTTSSSYWVQWAPPPPPPNPPITSSDEEQEENSTVEEQADYPDDYIYTGQDAGFQSPAVYAATESTSTLTLQDSEAPPDPYSCEAKRDPHQVVKAPAVISSPSSSSSSSSSHTAPPPHLHPASGQPRPVAMAIPTTAPWLINELGEPLGAVVAPPPYSYDPNGSDLPRDCRVLQYYFNLGVQWYQQSCWQQSYTSPSPEASYTSYPAYLGHASGQELHASHSSSQQTPGFPECSRADGHAGSALSLEGHAPSAPPQALLYQEQPLPLAPYEAPAPYLPSYHCLPAHWAGGVQPRLYCPAATPTHLVGYFTATPPHHPAAHFVPPGM